jgi:hypothetical protein
MKTLNALRKALDSLPSVFENVKSGNIQSLIIDYHYSAIILSALSDIAFLENSLDKLFRIFKKPPDDESFESQIQITQLYIQGKAMFIVQNIGKMGLYKEAIKNSPSNADIMREIQEIKDNVEPKEEEKWVTAEELEKIIPLKARSIKMALYILGVERKTGVCILRKKPWRLGITNQKWETSGRNMRKRKKKKKELQR